MRNDLINERCGDCLIGAMRDDKIKMLTEAMHQYDYCTGELFGGMPVLSEVEEAMALGVLEQQSDAPGDELEKVVRLIMSLEASSDDRGDFMMRVVTWLGLQGQKEMISKLEQDVASLICNPCPQ
jgi:hypothetical protein